MCFNITASKHVRELPVSLHRIRAPRTRLNSLKTNRKNSLTLFSLGLKTHQNKELITLQAMAVSILYTT